MVYLLLRQICLFTSIRYKRGASSQFDVIHSINERVRTGVWAEDAFVYVNTSWCLKMYKGGQVTKMHILNGLQYLPRPMALIGSRSKKNKIYLVDYDLNLVRYRVAPRCPNSITPVAPPFKKVGLSNVQERMSTAEDFEFSWKDNLLNGQYIMPAVRDQGRASSCLFQALCAAADIEMLKAAASIDPPSTSDIRFSASQFVADYEAIAGPIPLDIEHIRLDTALEFFQNQGVYAEGGGAAPQRYKIAGYQVHEKASFETLSDLIIDGKPVIGSIKIDTSYRLLKPGDIYDYNVKDRLTNEEGKTITHAVVLIGFGLCAGRPYLVFLNSYGEEWGEEGFGRVYMDRGQTGRYFTTIEF